MSKQRLQKYLASIGYGSRRSIEKLIIDGKIKVDNKIAELGCLVDKHSCIIIDNQKIKNVKDIKDIKTDQKYHNKILIYNKPPGEVCTRSDEKGRRTVFDNLPKLKNSRWINIGRLDINTMGMLLFTTDGEIANKLMHPSNNIDREYLVRIVGQVSQEKLNKLLKGIDIGDGKDKLARFKKITEVVHNKDNAKDEHKANTWYKVVITEGRNREVRRLWNGVDCTVNRLIRIGFGPYKLPKDLKQGEFVIIDKIYI